MSVIPIEIDSGFFPGENLQTGNLKGIGKIDFCVVFQVKFIMNYMYMIYKSYSIIYTRYTLV